MSSCHPDFPNLKGEEKPYVLLCYWEEKQDAFKQWEQWHFDILCRFLFWRCKFSAYVFVCVCALSCETARACWQLFISPVYIPWFVSCCSLSPFSRSPLAHLFSFLARSNATGSLTRCATPSFLTCFFV